MGYTNGFEWDLESISKLKQYTLYGYSTQETAEALGTTFKSIEQAKYRHNVLQYCIEKDKEIIAYKETTLPDDDYIISCDYHSPYHSEEWINRLLFIADRFGIRKHIIVGDLLDCDWAKHWYSDEKSTLDREIKYTAPVFEALDYFDDNYLIHGNHENRINRSTDGKIQARRLFHQYGEEVWDKKFHYRVYDKLRIGDKWMVVHPKSYSQIGGNVAIKLAEKFHCNIINAHGHFIAQRYSRSGEYMGIDLGGIFDRDKTEYINKSTTTHPLWNNGFGMLRNGKFTLFHDGTDWDFWLGEED